ncbi:MAG: FAD-dependent monooxygenase [Nitrospirae bacterium]|nr:FAD-dependent monooxygenase [Nitrospirota bacterium]
MNVDVAIVGAGAGGLTLATILGRAGLRVLMIDSRKEIHPAGRGELIQPLGLEILEELGLLKPLYFLPHFRNTEFVFLDGKGRPLMRSRYDLGDARFPFAVSLEPHHMDRMFLERLEEFSTVDVRFGASYAEHHAAGEGIELWWTEGDRMFQAHASVLVGDDGRRSAVRSDAGITGLVETYRDSYLSWSFDCPDDATDSVKSPTGRYFIGPGKIFFLFAVSPARRFFLYMLAPGDRRKLEEKGLPAFLRELDEWVPGLEDVLRRTGLEKIEDIPEMSVMKVDLDSWSCGQVVLIGDAAHAMNPHVAQGRNQAMEDARVLGETLVREMASGPAGILRAIREYESRRKPRTIELHRLADEMTWIWNSANPVIVAMREKVFRGMERTPSLSRKIVRTISGLWFEPLTPLDKIKAFWAG